MMGALIRALTNNAVENIEEALGMTDATSSAMKHAIAEWYAAWYGRVPTKTEDPCQRLPYAIVNKLCKATFGEYDSGLQHTDSAKGKYLDCVRSTFDACKTSFMTQAMIGGEAWAKPVPMPDGRLTWQIVGRDSIIILGRDASGIPSDVALCEKSVSADHHFYTLVERRTSFAGRLTIQYRLYCSDNKSTLGRRVPLASLLQYERLEDEYTFAVPIDGVGMVFLRMPITNCVDGSADGVSIYEPAMGLIHRINENELQFSREFELGRMRVVASADILRTHNGKKLLTDDVFVGLDGNEQSVGITPFAPALRNESYEARRQTYLKAIENLLGIKRGILSDAEAVSKTATEINSSAGDYSLSIMDFQHLYYDALQAALRLGDQIGQAYRLCDASAWDADELAVTWGNGVLYDADQEWTERKELVQMGLLKPELALAWKFDLPAETEADLAEIRKNYMPELKDLEGCCRASTIWTPRRARRFWKASSRSSRFPSAASTRPSSSFPARPGRKPAVTRRQPARPTSTSPSSRRMRSSSIRSTPRRRSSPRKTTRTRMPTSSAIAFPC